MLERYNRWWVMPERTRTKPDARAVRADPIRERCLTVFIGPKQSNFSQFQNLPLLSVGSAN